jgi:hypothetical protein
VAVGAALAADRLLAGSLHPMKNAIVRNRVIKNLLTVSTSAACLVEVGGGKPLPYGTRDLRHPRLNYPDTLL